MLGEQVELVCLNIIRILPEVSVPHALHMETMKRDLGELTL